MSSAPPPHHSTTIAFGVATIGIACFSAMDAVMKALAMALGAYNAMFWRQLAAAIIGGAIYVVLRAPKPTRAAMRIHLTRGIMSSVMGILFFWGLARVPLAQGVALSFVAPLIALYSRPSCSRKKINRAIYSLLASPALLVIAARRSQQ